MNDPRSAKTQERLKSDILKAADSIRQKYEFLKRGKAEMEAEMAMSLQPITDPLKELVKLKSTKKEKNLGGKTENLIENGESDESVVDDDPSAFFEDDLNQFRLQTPASTVQPRATTSRVEGQERGRKEEEEQEQEGEFLSLPQREDPSMQAAIVEHAKYILGRLGGEYVTEMVLDTKDKFDHKFGLRFNPETNGYMLGNMAVELDRQDNVHIENQVYKGTRGLFELLFKKFPAKEFINPEDGAVYKTILKQTNAHMQKFDPRRNIASSSSYKYKNFIKPLFKGGYTPAFDEPSTSGAGFVTLTNKPVDYLFYDNINEIVERLLLLKGSQQAGNGSHDLEIANIEEELRENGIIE